MRRGLGRSAFGVAALAGTVLVASPGMATTCTTTVTKQARVFRNTSPNEGDYVIVHKVRTKDASGTTETTTAFRSHSTPDGSSYNQNATSATLAMPNTLSSASTVLQFDCFRDSNDGTCLFGDPPQYTVDVVWTGKADVLVTHPEPGVTEWARRAAANVRSGINGKPVKNVGRVLFRWERVVCS